MISGLTFEYAHARVSARLAQRPDEHLWQRVRSARSVLALLEAVRASQAAAMVSGIPARDADLLEGAFRQQMRLRIAEVADWSPVGWQPALRCTALLVDLPALVQLLSDETPPHWIAADPVLARYALPRLAHRRAAIAEGPLARIAAAIDLIPTAATDAAPPPARRAVTVHAALVAWETEWRALWPQPDAGLDQLADFVRAHCLRFATLSTEETWAARESLGARLMMLLHRHPAEPAALFAGIALHALDLERLRGEFVLRARGLNGATATAVPGAAA